MSGCDSTAHSEIAASQIGPPKGLIIHVHHFCFSVLYANRMAIPCSTFVKMPDVMLEVKTVRVA